MKLQCHNITKKFGFTTAVDQFGLTLQTGDIHGLIGTNGAGKSTIINMISGLLAVDGGHITLDDHNITHYPAHKRAQMGLGRTFQKNTILPNFSVYDNILVVAQTHQKRAWQLWRSFHNNPPARQMADEILQKIGLQEYKNTMAHQLPHGVKRLLEIGLCLATDPKILLCDEPLAGMGGGETQKILQTLQQLQKNHAILLVEHDLNAVFQLATQITVMVNGRVLGCDTPDNIRQNPAVKQAYMGEFH